MDRTLEEDLILNAGKLKDGSMKTEDFLVQVTG